MSDDANQDEQFAIVTDSEEGERLELPLTKEESGDSDVLTTQKYSLGLATLSHAFPGAYGLKYKNPQTGASRALKMDASGTKFLPPADGWEDKIFYVIFTQPTALVTPVVTTTLPAAAAIAPAAPSPTIAAFNTNVTRNGDPNTKRRKMMEEEEDGDVEEVEGGGGGGTAKLKRLDTPPRCTDLIVLGLPYKTTQEQFKNYFEQFGKVAAAELKRDRQGNSKGFGFVQMESYDAQLSVLAQHTHVIDGRKCQVKIPNSKGLEYAQICKIFVGRLVEKWSQEDLRRFFAAEAEKINPQCQAS